MTPDSLLSMTTCSACSNPAVARGLCMTHYQRLRRYGSLRAEDPVAPAAGSRLVIDRFWSQVRIGAPDDCWPWTGRRSALNYGNFGIQTPAGWTSMASHRFAYILMTGTDVPRRLHIDHLCRNPICCNPRHAEVVTCRENAIRGIEARSGAPIGSSSIRLQTPRRRSGRAAISRLQ